MHSDSLITTSDPILNEPSTPPSKLVQSIISMSNSLIIHVALIEFIYDFFPKTNTKYTDINMLNQHTTQ